METVSRRVFLGLGGASLVLATAGDRAGAAEIEGQTAKDPNNMTPPEKKHVPQVRLGEAAGGAIEVDILIGQVEHPMEAEHHITWVDVYLDGEKLSRTTLVPVLMKPALKLTLTPKKSGLLTVAEECNLHGVWKNSTEIKVG